METHEQTHPSERQLAALALNKLTPEARERLKKHVGRCEACQAFLERTPRESLVNILRRTSASPSIAEQSTPGVRDASFSTRAGGSLQDRELEASALQAKPASDDQIPIELLKQSKYRIERLIGRGGMGSVYLAQHERMDRQVAIKVINAGLVDRPEALSRFDQEVKAAARLDHPNVARAYDADEFGSLRVLVMEFVPGQSLDRLLARRGQLSVLESCRLIRQAMIGLEHADAQGMVHRDLKPQNLMLTPQGKLKILDFGLAKVASEQQGSRGLTRENALMGTPHYLAPEQALDAAKADIRADIYSLGCTLYCLLTGSPPFAGDTEMKILLAHQTEPPRPLSQVRDDVSPALSDLVDRMLAKNPADRPQTPKEVAEALLPFSRSETPHSSAQPEDAVSPGEAFTGGAYLNEALPAGDTAALSRRPNPRKPQAYSTRTLAIAVGVVLLVLGAAWALSTLRVSTPEGTIIVENLPADADVQVDGATVTLTRSGDEASITAVKAGTHHLRVLRNDAVVWTSDAKVELAGEPVRLRYEAPSARGASVSETTVSEPKLSQRTVPVEQPPVAEMAPQTSPADWIPQGRQAVITHGGAWSKLGDELIQSDVNVAISGLAFGDVTWRNYDFQVEANAGPADRGNLFFSFQGTNPTTFRTFRLSLGRLVGNALLRHFQTLTGFVSQKDSKPAVISDHWHKIKIEVRGDNCRCFLNEMLILEAEDAAFSSGCVGLGSYGASARFRNILITGADGKQLWRGLPDLPGEKSAAPTAPTSDRLQPGSGSGELTLREGGATSDASASAPPKSETAQVSQPPQDWSKPAAPTPPPVAKVSSPPVPRQKPLKTALPSAVDLLQPIRLPKHAIGGEWKEVPSGLNGVSLDWLAGKKSYATPEERDESNKNGTHTARLAIPFEPSGEYEIRAIMTPAANDGVFGFRLEYKGQQFFCAVNNSGDTSSTSIGLIGTPGDRGTYSFANPPFALKAGHAAELTIRVQQTAISAWLDGHHLKDFPADYSKLSLIAEKQWPTDFKYLGFFATVPVTLHGLTITPLNQGTVESLPRPDDKPWLEVSGRTAKDITNSLGMDLAFIPAGGFIMGSPDSEQGRDSNEGPTHYVKISRPLYLGATEVTRREYESVTGSHPWRTEGDETDPDRAAGNITQLEAIEFCKRLTERERAEGKLPSGVEYRLPTEAEWEYACRAGNDGMYGFPPDYQLTDYAWYSANSASDRDSPRVVAQKRPNDWGLYDMHGNACEWCSDNYQADFYHAGAAVDPTGAPAGRTVVSRGGTLQDNAFVRAAHRQAEPADGRFRLQGFRVVRTISNDDITRLRKIPEIGQDLDRARQAYRNEVASQRAALHEALQSKLKSPRGVDEVRIKAELAAYEADWTLPTVVVPTGYTRKTTKARNLLGTAYEEASRALRASNHAALANALEQELQDLPPEFVKRKPDDKPAKPAKIAS